MQFNFCFVSLKLRFDVGPVLYQVEIPLHPHVRAPELTSIMAKVGADALSHVISNLHQFSSNSITQDESKALPSPKLTPDMADVDWSTSSPLQVYNLFRGLYGAFRLRTSFCGKLVNLDEVGLIVSTSKTQIVEKHLERSERTHNLDTDFTDFYSYPVTELRSDLPKDAQPGRIVFSKDILCVRCSDKNGSSGEPCWIFIRKVRIGTKWMNAKDFQNGFLSKLKVSDHCFRFTPTQSNAEGGDDNLQCKNSNKVQNT
jgi:methionyl-tRNA formyltransferase